MYSAVKPPEQTDANDDDKVVRPAGVSESNWKKFQELKKRREKSCKKSREKRRQEQRKNAIKQVKSLDETRILQEYGLSSYLSSNRKMSVEDGSSGQARKTENVTNEAKWKELNQYIPHNSDVEIFKESEVEINEAIKKGQFDKAGSLSERLSTQDFVLKVASAVKGRDFTKRRQEEQKRAQKTKKTKLHWGFQQKQRWESKGNM